MPNDKISAKLVVIFCVTMILGILCDLPYCASVSFFLCLLFSGPMEEDYFRRRRIELGIVKADDRGNVCITKKQYFLLHGTSAVIGSIFNVAAVFFSMPSYLIGGIDIGITVICSMIHIIMKHSLIREESC